MMRKLGCLSVAVGVAVVARTSEVYFSACVALLGVNRSVRTGRRAFVTTVLNTKLVIVKTSQITCR